MRILITGGTGFLGSHMTRALVHRGHEVICLKRRSSNTARLSDVEGLVRFHDVEDSIPELFERYRRFDNVIHMATNYGKASESLIDVLAANVMMPLQVLEGCIGQGACTFINADTFFVKADEHYAYLPGYVLSKRFFRELGDRFAKQGKCTFVNMRLEHVYGPGDGPDKFVTTILRRMLLNEPEIQLTPGEQRRDFIYVDDVVNAYLAVIGAVAKGTVAGARSFEVGTGAATSIREFVMMAREIIGSGSRLSFGALPYRDGEMMQSAADTRELRDRGWHPSVDLREGIARVVSSLRASTPGAN